MTAKTVRLLVSLWFCLSLTNALVAQDESETEKPIVEDPLQKEYESLSKLLTNSVFEGHFTVDGRDEPPKKELYELGKVSRLKDDVWSISARIKYGAYDVKVPLALPIHWAGTTPVITVDKVKIPGLGTFNARVVIADGKYAGTWQHDDVGGHLFGVIKPAAESDQAAATAPTETGE